MKNCKNCSSEISENAKFCGKCGYKTVEPEKESKKKDSVIESPLTNDIKNHLEFIGYTTEFTRADSGFNFLVARHDKKANLVITFDKNDVFTSFSTVWSGLKKVNKVEQYELLNKLTLSSTLSQIVISENHELKLYAMYLGKYDKKVFNSFIETFLEDNTRALTNEDFQKLFIE